MAAGEAPTKEQQKYITDVWWDFKETVPPPTNPPSVGGKIGTASMFGTSKGGAGVGIWFVAALGLYMIYGKKK